MSFLLIQQSKKFRFILTLLIALLGGALFSLIHIPVPWLLGPMASILIGSSQSSIPLYWPASIRDTGLLIFGYSIGLSFTKAALISMMYQLPYMLLFTFTILVICAILAKFVSHISGVNYPTILTGSIPGGLTQMIIFAEETKGIDVTIVTFFQVIRLLVIIFFIPLIVFSPLLGGDSGHSVSAILGNGTLELGDYFPNVIIFAGTSFLFAIIGKKIHSPTPFLLGPIIGTMVITLIGLSGPELPPSIIDLSQLMISVHIGLMMKPEKIMQQRNLLWLSILSGLILVGGSFLLSYLLTNFYDISLTTGFLSLAPGGMDQMGIIAHEVGANLPFVAGFQMFRLLFIYFAVPPMLRWIFKSKRKG